MIGVGVDKNNELEHLSLLEDSSYPLSYLDNEKQKVLEELVWQEGCLFKNTYGYGEIGKFLKRHVPIITEPIRDKIKKIRKVDDKENIYVLLYDGEIFTDNQLAKRFNLADNKTENLFKMGLDMLHFDSIGMNTPSLFIKDGGICFPRIEDVVCDNAYSREILNRIHLGTKEENRKNFEELRRILTPKQKGEMCAIVGTTLWNFLKKEFHSSSIMLHTFFHGASDTGKTKTAMASIFVLFGLDYREPFSGAEGESKFRLDLLSAATNLPVLIDDMTMNDQIMDQIRAKSGGGKSGRGRKDQTLNTLENIGTLCITSNNPQLSGEFYKQEANMKRFLDYKHESGEVIPEKQRYRMNVLVDNLEAGGYLYDLLEGMEAKKLKELKMFLSRILNGDERQAALCLGAIVLGLAEENIDMKTNEIIEDWRSHIYDYIKGVASKVEGNPDFKFGELKDKIRVEKIFTDPEGNEVPVENIRTEELTDFITKSTKSKSYVVRGMERVYLNTAKYAYLNSNFMPMLLRENQIKYLTGVSDLRELAKVTRQTPEQIYSMERGKELRKYINGTQYKVAKILLDSSVLPFDDGSQNCVSPASCIAACIAAYTVIDDKTIINNLQDAKTGNIFPPNSASLHMYNFCTVIAAHATEIKEIPPISDKPQPQAAAKTQASRNESQPPPSSKPIEQAKPKRPAFTIIFEIIKTAGGVVLPDTMSVGEYFNSFNPTWDPKTYQSAFDALVVNGDIYATRPGVYKVNRKVEEEY